MRSTVYRWKNWKARRYSDAGTKLSDDDRVLTNGGRVLCATALGHTVAEAQKRAYALMADIHWNGSFSRQDIGYRAIAREQGE